MVDPPTDPRGATDGGASASRDSPSPATRVVLSYPTDLSDWGRRQVTTRHFRAYLRRVHDTADVGETWPEFVGVGCCGDALDVPLRVESVDGGHALVESTRFAFEARDACDVEGGWRVQSAAGPSE